MNTAFLHLAVALVATVAALPVRGEGISISRPIPPKAKGGPVEFHAFGGKPFPVEIALEGKPGSTLEVSARIYAASQELAAPLRPTDSIGKVTLDAGGRGVLPASLPIPEVTEAADLAVRIEARAEGSPALVGACLVKAYPATFTATIEALTGELKRTNRALAVFGDSTPLRAFLTANKLPFVEMGSLLPAQIDDEFVYIGSVPPEALEQELPKSSGARVILFTRNEKLLPGVYRGDAEYSNWTKVTLPVLETLADDPLSQATFFHVLTQSLPTEPRRNSP